jgi:Fe-S-cluster containining protein
MLGLEKEGKGPFEGKVMRFFTSLVLPVDKKRSGRCLNCGACCKFLVKCPFLRSSDGGDGQFRCSVYSIRPLQCRKYPRTKREQIHLPCGYCFDGPSD